jgi:hypothetical protein
MTLVTRQAMADDDGTFIVGTVVNKAFVDQAYDQIDDQVHSTTNPTIKPKATIDEVVAARGSHLLLDARLDVSLNEDGTLKAQASLVTATDVQSFVGSRNVVLNGDFDDWSAGAAAAPDQWTLNGAGATVARTGPAEADTFSFGAGKYATKVTRVGNDCNLGHFIVAAADIADYAEIKGRKVCIAAKVKTSIAAHARIVVDDGVTSTASAFHTGTGTAEHLTVIHTISNSATRLLVQFHVVTTNGAAYVGGFQGVFSDFAPSDWQPISAPPLAGIVTRGLVGPQAQTFSGLKTFTSPPVYNPGGAASADATVSGRVHSQFATVGNVGTGEDTLMSYSLPANALNANGKGVRITAWGFFANNANSKTLKLYFGTITMFASPAIAHQNRLWRLDATLIRTAAGTVRAITLLTVAISNALSVTDGLNNNLDSAETLTAAVLIKVTGEATSNDDITQEAMVVEVIG